MTPKALLTRLVVGVVALALGILIGWAATGGASVDLFAALAANRVAFLAVVVLFPFALPLVQWALIMRRFYAQQKSVQLPHDMSWNREGIVFETRDSRAVIPFGNIHYWRESNQAILLYQNDMIPNFVLKRAFVSQDQLASFRAELKSSSIPQA
ncbi:MAG TPA: YcxB family protein [Xanthobacteraceae bacterium]